MSLSSDRAQLFLSEVAAEGRLLRTPSALIASMRYEVSSGGCWLWSGLMKANGYGMVAVGRTTNGTPVRRHAHRVMYVLMVGPVPEGMTLDHLCRNRRCVNPAHLEPVSNAENVLRGYSPPANNARKTSCPGGHAYTQENTYVNPVSGRRRCRTCDRKRDIERAPMRSRRLRAGELLIQLVKK